MRVLLINPAHPAVASRCHSGQMPPLGLLAVGGPLIDTGHEVRLIDAELGPLPDETLVATACQWSPDAILLGHSGSTSAHPGIVKLIRPLRSQLSAAWVIYGGVFPTYHAADVLADVPEIDVIVRGEGEATTGHLMAALDAGTPLSTVEGIAFRDGTGDVHLTPQARPITDLDTYRIGWELIDDWDAYQYWGAGRAAVIQFSRGCPHLCNYCGQRGFWTRWRYRTPELVAREIGELHRRFDVRFVDLADENPTTARKLWVRFLNALITERVPVQLVGTIRAADIVRDADILDLYKRAGFSRILMGVETTDAATLERIRKGTTVAIDREAIRLLRQHDILSQVAYVAGFEEQGDADYLRGLRQLLSYDPDQINAMYVTPHRWTPFYRESAARMVVEPDQSRWDYRHQVLAARIPTWRVFLWVKLTEAVLQLRPRALLRVLAHRDRKIRHALRWCYHVGRKVWLFEIRQFLGRRRRPRGTTLAKFWGSPQDAEENALDRHPLEPVLLSEHRESDGGDAGFSAGLR